jgi:CheY-like chemotaxis protein
VAQAATAQPAVRLATATVVVVESNPTARRIASFMLAASQARVIEVPSIVQAVAAMRTGQIDLMLCGQQVADGDARELVEAIRFERGGARTGVVVMVPVFQRTKDQILSQTGADALVVKPLRSANLLQVLEGVLEQRMHDDSVVSESVSAPTPVSGFSGKRILVVEDNPTNRTLALRILELLGLRAVAVASGREALATLATETFDLVLMDCQMPGIDGLEVTRLFREREASETALFRRSHAGHRDPRTVIVAVTAHAMGGDRERCIAAGMDDYLSKPYTIDHLRQMLEKWIG